MSRLTIAAATLAGLIGALAAVAFGGVAGAVLAVAVGFSAGLAVWLIQRDRVKHLVAQLEAWLAPNVGRRTVVTGPTGSWREVGTAVNAVGAAYDHLEQSRPPDLEWRRGLVDGVGSAALLFGPDGRLLAANARAREVLGLPNPHEGLTRLEALGSSVLAEAAARAGETTSVEVRADLGERHVRATMSRVGEDTLAIVSDRTSERRVEEVRRNFVVNASHELKTPATSIQALSEALEIASTRSPEQVPALVERLHEESQRLVRLVHDLLDLRRLEEAAAGVAVDLDVVSIVARVVDSLRERAEAADVRITIDAPERLEVRGLEEDLDLLVANLVANAIQYNRPGGEVVVRLRAEGGTLALDVRDTGIGIPQADLARIFERFYRVDVARSRETGGTGLGLAIVRHAAERQGGTVSVESLLGQGTTFSVRLPLGGA